MTDKPIDLNAERNRREAPDPEHVRKDDFGRPMGRFTCSYLLDDGMEWNFDIWAYDFEDAERKLAGIRASAKVDGQVFETFSG